MKTTIHILFIILILSPVFSFSGEITEIQKFLPEGINEGGSFWGRAVSIDGNRAIVGGPFSDVYIFEYDATADTWIETAKLNPPPGGGGAFGHSVYIEGDRALVGAYQNAGSKGVAYIFEYNATTNEWEEVVTLLASDGAADDAFGFSVSLEGDRAVIGAYTDDLGAVQRAGSAYVFERQTDGSWTEVAKLVASDGGEFEQFGVSVAASGDRILVGADFADSLAAYLFDYDATADQWVETQLIASDVSAREQFGFSVSLDGDRALVGALRSDNNKGAAYIFEYDATADQWDETKLTASDADVGVGGDFGYAVYIEGDLALIGAPFDDPDGIFGAGSAYLFKYNAGEDEWEEKVKLLVSDREDIDVFGTAVAISGGLAIVGSSETEFSGIGDSGAYLFGLPFASCGGFDVFGTAPGVYEAPDFDGTVIVSSGRYSVGTRGPDLILGSDGNDFIFGLKGDDVICGGRGKDVIFGGRGNDQLFGDDGRDVLIGGRGNDALDGGTGRDTCIGGPGQDTEVACE